MPACGFCGGTVATCPICHPPTDTGRITRATLAGRKPPRKAVAASPVGTWRINAAPPVPLTGPASIASPAHVAPAPIAAPVVPPAPASPSVAARVVGAGATMPRGSFVAKWPSVCQHCSKPIVRGQLARYAGRGKGAPVVHLDCAAVAAPVAAPTPSRFTALDLDDAPTPAPTPAANQPDFGTDPSFRGGMAIDAPKPVAAHDWAGLWQAVERGWLTEDQAKTVAAGWKGGTN